YDKDGASSRVRILQYLPWCSQQGIKFTVSPLLPPHYIARLYQSGKRNYLAIAWAYLRRLLLLLRSNKYDVVWIEKEIWPFVPAWVEKIFYKNWSRTILDYDDAIFLNYTKHRYGIVKWLLGNKIANIMGSADIVTVGNAYLKDYAEACGARDVRFLPSVVDIEKYHVRTDEAQDVFRIGWIGSPATRNYLESMSKVLKTLGSEHKIILVTIGLDDFYINGVEVKSVKWSEASEAKELRSLDIGIMPLFQTEWEKGKCAYKLIQYMACGLPVVATRFGANSKVVEQGKEGFLVDDDDEWIGAIKQLIENKKLYREMSLCARANVEESYTIQRQQNVFLSLFQP
ncbi:MAG: glycosyltransferase involved in cell wall biosynthesis, partial [Gammaproteobacteria bacterium]